MAWNRNASAVPCFVFAAPRFSAEIMSCHSPFRRFSDHTAVAMTPVMRSSPTV